MGLDLTDIWHNGKIANIITLSDLSCGITVIPTQNGGGGAMKIQILGTGCAKCNALAANAEQALKETGIKAEIEKVTDIQEIMKFKVLMTPAIAIDGKVLAAGRVVSPEDIGKFLVAAGGDQHA